MFAKSSKGNYNTMFVAEKTFTAEKIPSNDLGNWEEFQAPKGERGLKGDTGPHGTPGTNGAKGDAGPKGDTGEQGGKGNDGVGLHLKEFH